MPFLAWCEPPSRRDDPRRASLRCPGAPPWLAGPDAQRLAGLGAALRAARVRLGAADERVGVAIAADEPAPLVAAVARLLRRRDEPLWVLPPDPGALEPASAPWGENSGSPVVLVASAVSADGAPNTALSARLSAAPQNTRVVLDLTLAPWLGSAGLGWDPDGRLSGRPAVAIAALDRWHGEPHGTWGVWESTPWRAEPLVAAAAGELRCELGRLPGVQVPLAQRVESGTVSFRLASWPAEEAVVVLREAFGVWAGVVPRGALASRSADRGLRFSLTPDVDPEALGLALAALHRLAVASPTARQSH